MIADEEVRAVASTAFHKHLRRECERELGPGSDERWLIYELVHYALARTAARGTFDQLLAIERATSRAVQRYFSPLVQSGDKSAAGPLCAVDIDGVLETRLLEAPTIGPDGALALRALRRHGFRPVLVTGRSLPELIERCDAYGLAGGVAAYGGAVYEAANGTTATLLGADDVERLDRVRAALATLPGVVVDPSYVHSVRAYRVSPDGYHTNLVREHMLTAITAGGPGVRAVPGVCQTDFVAGPDKGNGVRALRELLGARLAFAIGDAEPDAPMLNAAEYGFVPAHAPYSLPGRRTRRPYQAGLLDASSLFLGHRACPTCAAPPIKPTTRLLFAALRAMDGGPRVKLAQAAVFAAAAARTSARTH